MAGRKSTRRGRANGAGREEKNDRKALDDLFAKADSLERQVGPDYARIVDGLGEVDPSSDEGKKFTALFDAVHKQCK